METYYNEFDPNAAQWLRNLGEAGEISKGVVDERSIKSVVGADLAGVRRAHFFAGIGGWELALRLAGWGDEEVWTGSCPCQPYSSAGKQKGDADERNLWPDFFRLIQERRPQFVFGEQVASAIKHGWLDRVFADLEGIGYACGAAVLGAHSVGANHIRQRLYWGAALGSSDADRSRHEGGGSSGILSPESRDERAAAERSFPVVRIQHTAGDGRNERGTESGERGALGRCGGGGVADGGMAQDADGRGRGRDGDPAGNAGQVQAAGLCAVGGISDRDRDRQAEKRGDDGEVLGIPQAQRESELSAALPGRSGEANPWSDFRLVLCTDGKARRTGAGVFPLAYGIPRRVGQGGSWRKGLARSASRARIGMLKGSGNAIVPELAAEFIRAFVESAGEP